MWALLWLFFFFQAEDGIRDLVRSRGLGDVYKRQEQIRVPEVRVIDDNGDQLGIKSTQDALRLARSKDCLLYTSDAADERSSVDLGGRRIIKKKNRLQQDKHTIYTIYTR